MSTTKPEKRPFSIEDFEKGLMLAGLVPPNSINDLQDRESLEIYEKELKKESGKVYFKRAVLAAEIAAELSQEPTFGRIKFQKLVYLCEHIANMNLSGRYYKQSAGPFDNKFMHSIEKEFKKQNWFAVEKLKEGNFVRSKYVELPDCEKYKKYFDSYFATESNRIREVIELFRKVKTDKAEIAATLFACAVELHSKKLQVTIDSLMPLFYAWSERKSQYNSSIVVSTWEWMVDYDLVPR